MNEETTALAARVTEIDQRDDDQIIAILAGELVEEYVYSFKDKRGRKQEGLSWAGIREYAHSRGNIVLDEPQITEHDGYWRVMVRVTDLDRNFSVWGGTHQSKHIVTTDGVIYDDPFAFEKALSKAQRNAIKNIMPMTVAKAAIERLQSTVTNSRPRQQQVKPQTQRRAVEPAAKPVANIPEIIPAPNDHEPDKEAPTVQMFLDVVWSKLKISVPDVLGALSVEHPSEIDPTDKFAKAWAVLKDYHKHVGGKEAPVTDDGPAMAITNEAEPEQAEMGGG